MEPCAQHRQTAVTVHASFAARWGWLSKPDRSAVNGAGLWQMRQAVLKKKKKEKKGRNKRTGAGTAFIRLCEVSSRCNIGYSCVRVTQLHFRSNLLFQHAADICNFTFLQTVQPSLAACRRYIYVISLFYRLYTQSNLLSPHAADIYVISPFLQTVHSV